MKTYIVQCYDHDVAVQCVKIKANSEAQAVEITKRLVEENKLKLNTKTPTFKVN